LSPSDGDFTGVGEHSHSGLGKVSGVLAAVLSGNLQWVSLNTFSAAVLALDSEFEASVARRVANFVVVSSKDINVRLFFIIRWVFFVSDDVVSSRSRPFNSDEVFSVVSRSQVLDSTAGLADFGAGSHGEIRFTTVVAAVDLEAVLD
jgi:hypothetical protein